MYATEGVLASNCAGADYPQPVRRAPRPIPPTARPPHGTSYPRGGFGSWYRCHSGRKIVVCGSFLERVCVFCCSGLSCFMWGIGMRDRYSRCLVCFWMMENKSIPALKKYFSSNQYSPRWTTCPFLSVRLYCVLWKTMSEAFYFSVGNDLRAYPRNSLYLL